MKLGDILATLPKLNKQEIATVKAAVEHLMGGINTEAADATAPLYDAVANAAGVRMSYQIFKGTFNKEWKKNSAIALTFIDETFVDINKSTRMAIMTYLAHALADDLKQRKIPVSIRSMVVNLGRLPQVFEDAFPQYKQSGLIHLIIRSMENRTGE